MNSEMVVQLGIGAGIIAAMVLREVIPLLRNSSINGNGSSKNGSVSRQEYEQHKTVVRYADTCEKIHKGVDEKLTDIKDELKEIHKSIRKGNGHD